MEPTADEIKPLDDDAVSAALQSELQIAVSFIDTELGPQRALATKYYRGEPFGDEEQGRSKIVMPLVRDTARATLPSLMRTFFGGINVVEFSPGSDASSAAAQMASDATATVNHVLMNQNPGFLTFWSVFKDALVRKTGWVTWWWDTSINVSAKYYSGVTEEQLNDLAAVQDHHEHIDILGKEQVGTHTQPGPAQPEVVQHPVDGSPVMTGRMVPGQPVQVPIFNYSLRITKKAPRNKVSVCAVPPEEVIFSPECADIDGERAPLLIGRRQEKIRGDLIAMGIPDDLIDESGGGDTSLSTNVEVLARAPQQFISGNRAGQTKDQQKIPLYDLYYRIDADQDGITELRHIIAVGSNLKIWKNDYADEVQLALFCPDPEPHVLVGLSQAETIMDLQLINSHITRDVLDSLKASIFPRTAYVEGQVNTDDILNTEIGAAIRMRQPNMVQEFSHEFTGQRALPLFDLFDQVREQRTGIGRAAMGMNAGALQSTTPEAAMQTLTAAQSQIELTARIFAETGMKRVCKGVLKLLCQYQNHDMQFRLNGRDFTVNPSKWDVDLDVSVDTGLGTGNVGNKLQALTFTATQQQGFISGMGANNPMCSLQEVYNTQRKILECAGVTDIQNYWRNPKEAQQFGATIQAPKSPEATLAEAEMTIKNASESRAMLDMILSDDREREKMVADMFLRAADIAGHYGVQVDVAQIQGAMKLKHLEAQSALANSAPSGSPTPTGEDQTGQPPAGSDPTAPPQPGQ